MYGRRKPRRARNIEGDEGARERKPLDPEKTRKRTLERAVKLLAAKPRSIGEMRERLLEKEWTSAEAVDAAIAKLSEYGYLDDERFAESFAHSRVRQRPVGRTRLALDLQMKKISRDTANQALDAVFAETPEEKLIDEAIARRARLRGRPQTREESKSLFDHLLRRGFGYELVIRKVRALSAANFDTDADEAPPD